jgi:hypothetical protein
MAVANQTTYIGWAVSPSGRKLVFQAGTANFGTNTLVCTLVVRFRRLISGQAKTNNPPIAAAKSAMLYGVTPYISASQYTIAGLPVAYRCIVNRFTAGGALAAASRFSYLLIGY